MSLTIKVKWEHPNLKEIVHLLLGRDARGHQVGSEQHDRVALQPRLLLLGVAVVGAQAQALGVLVEAVGDDLDQRRPIAASRAM